MKENSLSSSTYTVCSPVGAGQELCSINPSNAKPYWCHVDEAFVLGQVKGEEEEENTLEVRETKVKGKR